MGSVLLGLPREIKELIYFDALSHTANKILVSLTNVCVASLALLTSS
jgi:exocyst complex component 6